jgi:hypothetical protein
VRAILSGRCLFPANGDAIMAVVREVIPSGHRAARQVAEIVGAATVS